MRDEVPEKLVQAGQQKVSCDSMSRMPDSLLVVFLTAGDSVGAYQGQGATTHRWREADRQWGDKEGKFSSPSTAECKVAMYV